MIKVSIIVPVYNAEKYLHKCFDSLVNQTLEEIEILAVNDGSTDGSLAILEEYRDKYPDKIKVFTKENGGQASARNLALRYAVGEYIGYVDADDYADITMFEKLYRKAAKTGVDLAVCDHWRVEKGKNHYVSFPKYCEPREMFKAVLVSPWNKLFRREILLDSGVIFPEGYIYEDTAWFAELIPFLRTMAYVGEPLLYHIVQENSTMTAAQGERTAQIFPVMNSVVEYFKNRQIYDRYRNELEYFYIRILFLSSIGRISKIEDKKIRNQYVRQTVFEVKEHFPYYKKNPYLTGWRGIYIKLTNNTFLKTYIALHRLQEKLKGRRQRK